jgi:hypothetical protein
MDSLQQPRRRQLRRKHGLAGQVPQAGDSGVRRPEQLLHPSAGYSGQRQTRRRVPPVAGLDHRAGADVVKLFLAVINGGGSFCPYTYSELLESPFSNEITLILRILVIFEGIV